ncbi:hypothetical protein BRADI_1g59042v3 [Brachypodium distachyon]|uniref:Uncharacterized protein n=1 Tax=Brachypodium distachyon TaxID=15368 RepID=A0A0Q3HEG4_BRADI|nr:hypothetical protein BRADI_1g59042v3 [Brachypodium distachyon]
MNKGAAEICTEGERKEAQPKRKRGCPRKIRAPDEAEAGMSVKVAEGSSSPPHMIVLALPNATFMIEEPSR